MSQPHKADNTKTASQNYPIFEDSDNINFIGDVSGVEFDLASYDIDIVEDDGSVYIPYNIYNDLFSETGSFMVYKKEKLAMSSADSLSGAKGSEDAAKILTGYSLKCQEASYNDAAVLYGDVLRNIMLNTDTLQYKLDYDTMEYEPIDLTPFEISVDPGETRDKYGY